MLRDLLENFGSAFSQRSRAGFLMSVHDKFRPGTTDIASKIATQRGYEYPVSVSVDPGHETGLPVNDGTKSFPSRVIREFLDCWKPDVRHEATSEMSSSDEDE